MPEYHRWGKLLNNVRLTPGLIRHNAAADVPLVVEIEEVEEQIRLINAVASDRFPDSDRPD